jgi:CRISPR/Cas system endoribonuclease Cas6 (RAMP superfamily)
MPPEAPVRRARQLRESQIQGVTTVCRFTVKPAKTAPQHRNTLGTLVRYSFYAGTGQKTTMGMGVTGFMGFEPS